MKPIETVEDAQAKVEEIDISKPTFELHISDKLQDPVGINMAIILDKILGKNFEPDGFEQEDGYRIYKYKKME